MTGVGSSPRDLQSWMRDIHKRLVAQERRRIDRATWDGISDKPTTFPPSPHTHAWADLTDPLAHNLGTIQGSRLPGEFPVGVSFGQAGVGFPESDGTVVNVRHTGYRQFQQFYNRNTTEAGLYIRTANGDSEWTPWVQMSSRAYVDGKTWDWGTDITGKPATFPPSYHVHSAVQITSGTLDPARLPPLALNVVGMVQMTAAAKAPSGWLLCDGAAVSRTTYADLFAAIGTTYGKGDGSTTFNLPNMKGRVPVGLDAAQAEFDALGKTGGSKTHTLSQGEMPSHTHYIDGPLGGQLSGTSRDPTMNGADGAGYTPWFGGGWGAAAARVAASGSSQPHNNLQPYATVNFIIKT